MSKFVEFCKRYPRWNKPIDFKLAERHAANPPTGHAPGQRATKRRILQLQEELHCERESFPAAPNDYPGPWMGTDGTLDRVIDWNKYDLFLTCYGQ